MKNMAVGYRHGGPHLLRHLLLPHQEQATREADTLSAAWPCPLADGFAAPNPR
jgi:hypothetical protein